MLFLAYNLYNNYYYTKIYNARIVTHQAWIGGAASHQQARRSVLIVNKYFISRFALSEASEATNKVFVVNELGYEMRL